MSTSKTYGAELENLIVVHMRAHGFYFNTMHKASFVKCDEDFSIVRGVFDRIIEQEIWHDINYWMRVHVELAFTPYGHHNVPLASKAPTVLTRLEEYFVQTYASERFFGKTVWVDMHIRNGEPR